MGVDSQTQVSPWIGIEVGNVILGESRCALATESSAGGSPGRGAAVLNLPLGIRDLDSMRQPALTVPLNQLESLPFYLGQGPPATSLETQELVGDYGHIRASTEGYCLSG